jgi:hypothetical protein
MTTADDAVERSFWYRVTSDALFVVAGVSSAAICVGCFFAAPLALAFRSRDADPPGRDREWDFEAS